MKEQEEALRRQLQTPAASEFDEDPDTLPTLKVTWKARKSDESNGGYSMEGLHEIFSKVRSISIFMDHNNYIMDIDSPIFFYL